MIAQPFKRFTKEEIKSARYFHLRICTSGLDNPKELDEAFSYENACPECNAGRIPTGELNLPRNSMGKKKLEQNFRYGYLIFDEELVKLVSDNNLTGIEFKSAVLGRDAYQFKEGRILNIFPKLSEKTILHTEQLCKTCGKSGHYDAQEAPTVFWLSKGEVDKLNLDFYLTWEYFGVWDMGQTYPLPIVSKNFRKVIIENMKLKHLKFEPIFEK